MYNVDANTLLSYLRLVSGSDSPVFIRAFVDKGHDNEGKLPIVSDTYDPLQNETWQKLDALQEQGYGLHASLNTFTTTPKKGNMLNARLFAVDIDNSTDWEERLARLPVEPSLIVSRGVARKAHLYWVFEDPKPLADFDWSSYQMALAKWFDCVNVKECSVVSTLLRLPGTWHHKNGDGSQLKIIGGSEGVYPTQELMQVLDTVIERSKFIKAPQALAVVSTALTPSMEEASYAELQTYLEQNPAPKKDGVKQKLYVVACRAKELGVPMAKALTPLIDWANASGRYPTVTVEIRERLRMTVADAYKFAQNAFGSKALKVVASPENTEGELERASSGVVKSSLSNIEKVIHFNPFFTDLYAYNEFTHNIEVRKPTTDFYYRPDSDPNLLEIDTIELRSFCSANLSVEFSKSLTEDAVLKQSFKHAYHPLKQYLRSLKWDGVPRLEDWLITYCKASPRTDAATAFVRWAGTSFLIAAVARIFKPGIKYDHMLILEGPIGGQGKSTVFKILGGEEWYKEESFNVRANESKDYQESLDGAWFIEMGEMANMIKTDQQGLLLFISRTKSHYRKAYDRRGATYQRQYVLGATTNKREYLTTIDGSRRFLPVRVGEEIDIDGLERDRDQIFAEACARYRMGFHLGMPREIRDEAYRCTGEKQLEDAWIDAVQNFLQTREDNGKGEHEFTVAELYSSPMGLNGDIKSCSNAQQVRIAKILRAEGYDSRRVGTRNFRKKVWVKQEVLDRMAK